MSRGELVGDQDAGGSVLPDASVFRLRGLLPATFCGVELECPQCGGDLRANGHAGGGKASVACRACGSDYHVRIAHPSEGPPD
jgi:uncharacterized protein (DUF983 family)